jgi:gamma-glutamylcyclotransferase (GGCT)/AIG2-like uncharacterized protein YtfP
MSGCQSKDKINRLKQILREGQFKVEVNHIFVYGTLRRGAGAYEVFGLGDHTDFVSTTRLTGHAIYHLGGFPGIRESLDDVVIGDLMKIKDTKLLRSLDQYEGYRADDPDNSLYHRKMVLVDDIPSWVYVYNGRVKDTARISSGDWFEQ